MKYELAEPLVINTKQLSDELGGCPIRATGKYLRDGRIEARTITVPDGIDLPAALLKHEAKADG